MRGGAGAEIGRAGVPAADRRQGCSGPSPCVSPRAARPSAATAWRSAGPTGTRMSSRSAACCRELEPEPHLRRSLRADRAVGSRPDRRQPARRAGDGRPRRRPPAAYRLAAAAQRAQRFPPAARHGRAARAGGARPGARRARRRAARRRRADRADLCAGGGHDQERSRLAARCARRCSPTAIARASGCGRRSMGQQWSVLQLYLALWPRDHRARRDAQMGRSASSPARR